MTASQSDERAATPFIPILMAKYPEPGSVKSRLFDSGDLTAADAAGIALKMLKCTIRRLATCAGEFGLPMVLAVTPDDAGPALLDELALPEGGTEIHVHNQGEGDLGARMLRQWIPWSGTAVAFFGGDTPDIPSGHLRSVAAALTNHDLAVGPTEDGGYWTLAGHEPTPEVLTGIHWGTGRVFRETKSKAEQCRRKIAVLPQWVDVDHPQDVRALIRRIGLERDQLAADEPVLELRRELLHILSRSPSAAAYASME